MTSLRSACAVGLAALTLASCSGSLSTVPPASGAAPATASSRAVADPSGRAAEASALPQVSGSVPMYKGGPGRTGESSGDAPLQAPRSIWSIPGRGRIESAPALADGALIIVDGEHRLRSIDAATGTERWTESGEHFRGSPTVADGLVLVVGDDFALTARSIADGRERWRAGSGITPASNPLVVGELVVVAGVDRLAAFDLRTGASKWMAATSGTVAHSIASDGRHVVVGTQDGVLRAVDLATGSPVWKLDTGGTHFATISVRDGIIVAMAAQDPTCSLLSIDADSGRIRWRFDPPPGTCLASPSVSADEIYIASDAGVYAIARPDGSVRWRADDVSITAAPLIVASTSVVGFTRDGQVVSLARATGTALWSVDGGDVVHAGGILADGVIFFGTSGGTVAAFAGQ